MQKTFKYINAITWEVTKVTANDRKEADQRYFEETGETSVAKEVSVKIMGESDKPKKQYSEQTFSDYEGHLFNRRNRRFYQ